MDKAAIRTLVRRYYAVFAQGGALSVADEILSPTFHCYLPGLPEGMAGPAVHKDLYAASRGAFTAQVHTVTHELIDGASAACRWTFTAVHSGPYAGVLPTGRDIMLEGMDLFRVEAGRIEELRRYFDLLDLRSQLHGVMVSAR